MEDFYMAQIWDVFSLKVNESLTNKEKQDKIKAILSLMKKDAQDFTKLSFKKECINTITKSLNDL